MHAPATLADRAALRDLERDPYPAPPGWPRDWPHPAHLTPGEAMEMLENGNSLTQPIFHAAYLRTPENFSAELVGGVVSVASPLSRRHGLPHAKFTAVLSAYEDETPGVEVADNTSAVLTNIGEAQPDLYLRVRRDHGGRTTTFSNQEGEVLRSEDDGDYVSGGPEFVLEVSKSSIAVDTNAKLRDYLAGGVQEYVVADVRRRVLRWYHLSSGSDAPLLIPEDGVLKSLTMPGLWLNGPALFVRDGKTARATLAEGLASPEHEAFVAKLAAAKDRHDAAADSAPAGPID